MVPRVFFRRGMEGNVLAEVYSLLRLATLLVLLSLTAVAVSVLLVSLVHA
jgi:hypothetical protein